MPVSAVEHRIRTGLYNCKGVLLLSSTPKSTSQSSKSSCNDDQHKRKLCVAMLLTALLLLTHRVYLITATVLEVVLQQKIVQDLSPVQDVTLSQPVVRINWTLVTTPIWTACHYVTQIRPLFLAVSTLCITVITLLFIIVYLTKRTTVLKSHLTDNGLVQLSLQCELQVAGYSLSKVVCALIVLTIQAGMITAILLLMSGDVETNPGPTILNIDVHLMPILEAIWDARSQWRNIGRKLGLKEGDIQAMRDPNDAGECLHEVLSLWIHSDKAVIHDLIQVLDSKVIDRSDIVREIHSRVGDERIEVGLDPSADGDSQEQYTSPLERMEKALSETPTLEELCTLPIEKTWYQVGLWMGIDDHVLRGIKAEAKGGGNKDALTKMFQTFSTGSLESKSLHVVQYIDEVSQSESTTSEDKLSSPSVGSLTSEDNSIYGTPPQSPTSDNGYTQPLASRPIQSIPETPCSKEQQTLCSYSRLVKALVNTGNQEVAEKACSQKGIILSEYLEATSPDSGSSPPKCLVSYANSLKEKYRQMRVIPDDWPPAIAGTDNQFTNLALILTEDRGFDHIETIAYDYAHGKIDNIIARKQAIEIKEVFYPIIDKKTREASSRLTILMDGAPGVGKSTIARKICIDWANGDILQEYLLVILVQLREITNTNDIADLLSSCSKSRKAKVAECMDDFNISGKRILFIFDGFDELSTKNRSNQSLFLKIVSGKVLHNCSVLVTSRPYSSSHLRTMSRVNRHVEVIGFSSEQIVQCVQQTLPCAEQASKLIKMLKERLDIVSLCYIPLNCRIVLFVYQVLKHELPSTLTELYETFILHTIKHHAKRTETDPAILQQIYEATQLSDLPASITEQLSKLYELAFEGMKNDQLSFDGKTISQQTLSLGLMNSIHSINVTGPQQHYQFLHLAIQEFLAAKYVASNSKMSSDEKCEFLRTNLENTRYRMTLLFLVTWSLRAIFQILCSTSISSVTLTWLYLMCPSHHLMLSYSTTFYQHCPLITSGKLLISRIAICLKKYKLFCSQ